MTKKLLSLVLAMVLCMGVMTGCKDEPAQPDNAPVQEETEKTEADFLLDALGEKAEGHTIMETGEEEIDGVMCKTFSFGVDSPEKFTTEGHFAVTPDGKIYQMDILEGEYKPFE